MSYCTVCGNGTDQFDVSRIKGDRCEGCGTPRVSMLSKLFPSAPEPPSHTCSFIMHSDFSLSPCACGAVHDNGYDAPESPSRVSQEGPPMDKVREALTKDIENFIEQCRYEEAEGGHDGGMNPEMTRRLLERILAALSALPAKPSNPSPPSPVPAHPYTPIFLEDYGDDFGGEFQAMRDLVRTWNAWQSPATGEDDQKKLHSVFKFTVKALLETLSPAIPPAPGVGEGEKKNPDRGTAKAVNAGSPLESEDLKAAKVVILDLCSALERQMDGVGLRDKGEEDRAYQNACKWLAGEASDPTPSHSLEWDLREARKTIRSQAAELKAWHEAYGPDPSQPPPALPDDFSESKDWRESDYAGRVEWLVVKVSGQREEIRRLASPPALPSREVVERVYKVNGRLGAYLNTMVADLDIQLKGEYLRELFGKWEKEMESALEGGKGKET